MIPSQGPSLGSQMDGTADAFSVGDFAGTAFGCLIGANFVETIMHGKRALPFGSDEVVEPR